IAHQNFSGKKNQIFKPVVLKELDTHQSILKNPYLKNLRPAYAGRRFEKLVGLHKPLYKELLVQPCCNAYCVHTRTKVSDVEPCLVQSKRKCFLLLVNQASLAIVYREHYRSCA